MVYKSFFLNIQKVVFVLSLSFLGVQDNAQAFFSSYRLKNKIKRIKKKQIKYEVLLHDLVQRLSHQANRPVHDSLRYSLLREFVDNFEVYQKNEIEAETLMLTFQSDPLRYAHLLKIKQLDLQYRYSVGLHKKVLFTDQVFLILKAYTNRFPSHDRTKKDYASRFRSYIQTIENNYLQSSASPTIVAYEDSIPVATEVTPVVQPSAPPYEDTQ